MKLKINLTKENKNRWNELGFITDESKIFGDGTFDRSDYFVDNNFGNIYHPHTDLTMNDNGDWIRGDLDIETIVLFKTLFEEKLVEVDV
ncbi:MAG: hypothetical protein M0Q88_00200 [Bacilli bacterium]|nr:hypothetical protein [Bacilli bacterium]